LKYNPKEKLVAKQKGAGQADPHWEGTRNPLFTNSNVQTNHFQDSDYHY
jgi:hypothetical protein